MIRLLRGLVAVVALFSIHSTARAFDYTQVPWGIRLGISPAPLCMTTGGDACKSQIGTIRPSTGVFTPLSPNIAYALNSSGIVCDGSTDANAGGALAIAANAAATARQKFYLPPFSDCHIKTAFSLLSNADWEGFGTTISFDAAVNTAGSLNVAMSLDNAANWRLSGITFNGPGSASINQNARIGGDTTSNGLIVNSTFQNFGTQTAFTGTLTSGSNVITSVSSIVGLKTGMNVNFNNNVVGAITSIGTTTVTMGTNATTNGVSSLVANFYAQGLLLFHPANVTVDRSVFQTNSGDGVAFSNNGQGNRILNSRFINNQDSAFVLCTIGGSNNQAIGNTVSAPSNLTTPAIVSERCQNSVIDRNTVNSGAGSAAIRIARYGDTADFNQDIVVTGNTVTGGGGISIENAGYNQGSVSVPFGGLFTVANNHVLSPSGAGIQIIDSTNGTVTGNTVTNAGDAGIIEESFVTAVGNSTITGNVIDGATYCLRQVNAGGSVSKSQYTGNWVTSCSVTPTQFVSADYFDRGNISGSAASLVAQAGNTTVGNGTASSASPTALTMPSCSAATSALTWTTSGGTTAFGCNTVVAGVANPTASVGLTAVNGTATTAMRSDGAPALSQSIVPTWTGIHTFSAAPVFSLGAKYSGSSSGTVTVLASATAGTPTITWGNASGTPTVTASAPLALSTTTGNMTVTGAAGQVLAGSTPAFTATPTLGVAGSAIGTLALAGNTSGTATITPQATAGSPTLTLPNASGTFAVSATSPVTLSATTGAVGCATCVTSSGGGAITGTAPVAVSAAGAVSITGAAGQVLAGASPAFTATPTLGVAGSTVGSLAFANATSGSVTLQPVTGALGSAVLSMPAATDTLIGKATTDALTNKTYDTASTGNSFSINGLAATANTGTGSVVRATSPTLTTAVLGSSTATTQAANDNSTKVATTAYVQAQPVTASQMPALTGSCTTSAGAVAVTCEQDGAASVFSSTVTTAGTLPTTSTASIRWKQIGTKLYKINLVWNITAVGSATNGFFNFTLPNSSAGAITEPCSSILDRTLGTAAGNIAYVDTTSGPGHAVMSFLSAPLQHEYDVSCVYEAL